MVKWRLSVYFLSFLSSTIFFQNKTKLEFCYKYDSINKGEEVMFYNFNVTYTEVPYASTEKYKIQPLIITKLYKKGHKKGA